jgi:hypothetical protein
MVKFLSFKPIKLVQIEEKGTGLCQIIARELGGLIRKVLLRNHKFIIDV